MKKLIIFILSFFIFSFSFAYSPTQKDLKFIETFNKKVENLNQDKIENLKNKINKIKQNFIYNKRIYFILSEIENNLIFKKEYKVISVIDWDTIKIDYNWVQTNIRMIWIDSPESNPTRYWYVECYWDEAKKYLTSLIEWKKIELEIDSTQWEKDKYWRLLAYIIYSWENINQKMIEDWYAREYTYNLPYKYQSEFKQSQKNASEKNIWLWSESTCNWERKNIDEEKKTESNNNSYSCNQKKYCTEMNSCEEAKYHLFQCWIKTLDSDKDWIPCEKLCNLK